MPKQIKAETEPTTRFVGPAQPPLPTAAPPVAPVPPGPAAAAPDAVTVGQSTLDSTFQTKVYQPHDVACRHQNDDLTNCGAEQGEPCKWQQPGMDGTCHAERIEDAAAISQRDGIKPTKEQFDQAVLDTGLV